MAIPDFQTIMLPLLQHLADGEEHSNQETLEAMARHFDLTEDELTELLPSGQQTVVTNRVAWAKTHMKAAGLIESPERAHYRITDEGRALLARKPDRIDMKTLRNYPSYVEFRNRRREKTDSAEEIAEADSHTPQERLELAYQTIREQLAEDLVDKIKGVPPQFFERLVAMGYGGSRRDAGATLGRSGDGGVDGVIKEDRLGLDVIYLQAKRWDGVVGRPEIQKFAGALQGQRAKKGVFITTSAFSKEAREYAGFIDTRIVLIDGDRLAHLMIDHDIGVSLVGSYHIKRLDSDYFEEG